MICPERHKKKPRLGDLVIFQPHESGMFSSSKYQGVVICRTPLILYPVTGHGTRAVVITHERWETIRLPFILRAVNYVRAVLTPFKARL